MRRTAWSLVVCGLFLELGIHGAQPPGVKETAGLHSGATRPSFIGERQPQRSQATPVSASSSAAPAVHLDRVWGVGAWIWDRQTFEKQTCRLWRAFDIPRGTRVVRARLAVTADNSYVMLLDGHEIGRGSEWRNITEFEISSWLEPGRHVMAINAFNDDKQAGVLAGLRIELGDGRVMEIPSDQSWRVVPEGERGWDSRLEPCAHWLNAVVVGQLGTLPWSKEEFAGPTRVSLNQLGRIYFWNRAWFQLLLLSVCGVTVVMSLRLMARQAVRVRAEELLQRERARIARDIHDEVGAGLTQLLLIGEVARKEIASNAPGFAGVERLRDKTLRLSEALDQIVWAVNSSHDSLGAFARHACKYAQTFFANTPVRCRLDVAEIPALPFHLAERRNLFLALKEVLNNVAKHSGAHEVFLRIHWEGEEVVVKVEDDGCGFDHTAAGSDRNGLSNLRQRLAEMGGTCEVQSAPGAGCKVTLRAPLCEPTLGFKKWWNSLRARLPRPWATAPGAGRQRTDTRETTQ